LGTFRYKQNALPGIAAGGILPPLLAEEFELCADGKFRYLEPVRLSQYQRMFRALKHGAPRLPVYMCMETPKLWRAVAGFVPRCNKDFGGFLTGALAAAKTRRPGSGQGPRGKKIR